MSAVAWSVFFDEVLPWVPGCTTTMATAAVRRAVIELCDKGLIWKLRLTAINAVKDQMTYSLSPGITNIVVAKTLNVRFNGKLLTRRSPSQLNAEYGDNVEWRDKSGTPMFFTEEAPAKLMIVPAPDAAATGAIKVEVALRPTEAATGVDDTNFDFWHDYVRVVADGALAYLKAEPKKPWSDPVGAAKRRLDFETAIGSYSYLASKGGGGNNRHRVVTHFN